ncbi:hypothetical protein CTRI78_v011227 [Colletotrichum trifolii]|uniref:Uncharacterized protein n=1 Tax=Colletotrichum trifolii TaxID=5466 RepID=A0A4R8QKN9_COLTR|nr:hypothetical protein CTRI78_v011227 [Colletotrichum trifolii]
MARVINRNQDSEPTPSGSYTRSQQATDEALRLAPHQIRFAGACACACCCCDGLSPPRLLSIWTEAIRRWLPICRSVTSVTPVSAAWAIVTDSLGCRPSTRSTDFRRATGIRPTAVAAASLKRASHTRSKIAVAPVEPTGDPESDKARDTYK